MIHLRESLKNLLGSTLLHLITLTIKGGNKKLSSQLPILPLPKEETQCLTNDFY